MASLFLEQSIWTIKDIITVPDSALACRCYREKARGTSKYEKLRETYEESRGRLLNLKSRRCGKVLENLKEIEGLLQHRAVIDIAWRENAEIQILLDDNTLLTVALSENREDPDRLLVDRSLCSHLSKPSSSGAVGDNVVVCASDDSALVDIVTFCRPFRRSSAGSEGVAGGRKLEKLSALNPKFGQLDLGLPEGLSVRKRVRFNCRCDKIAVWWTSHFWPPSDDLRNVNICQITSGTAKKVFEFTTDHPLVALDFRRSLESELALAQLEQRNKDSFTLHVSLHELREKEIVRRREAALSLSNAVVSWDPHPREEVFLLLTDSAKCILFDMSFQTSREMEAANVSFVRWHENGLFFFVLSSSGDLQVFDLAGTAVNLLFQDSFAAQPKPSVNLLKYFRCNKKLLKFTSNRQDPSRWIVALNSGPLTLLSLPTFGSPADLARIYLHGGFPEAAVRLLKALHWNSQPEECCATLTAVLPALLTRPALKENVELCEEALASFFISKETLSETVRLEFRERLMLLSRSFFFYLLRHRHMEKAFLLAEDLGHLDLFSDLHKGALQQGDTVLAEVARLRASQRRLEEQEDAERSEIGSDDSCGICDESVPQEIRNLAFEEMALKEFSKMIAFD